MIDCDGAKPMVSLARKPMDETAQYCTTAKVVPVRIVPEAEYKRMRQAERSLMAMDREWEAKLAKQKAVNRGK
jgi:hypothetical protein